MYLPKSKYKVSMAKPGEFIDKEGNDYVGPIVETFTGNCYPGSDPLTMGPKLTKVSDRDGESTGRKVLAIKRIPTEEEYKQGWMERYFWQDLKTQKIVEILPDAYKEASRLKDVTRKLGKTDWILIGVRSRVQELNQQAIDKMERELPGISSSKVLCNPLQFYKTIYSKD